MSEKTETKGAEKHDEEQERLLAEECILVDGDDKVTGHASKRFCKTKIRVSPKRHCAPLTCSRRLQAI